MKRILKITAFACFMVLVGSTVNKVSAQYYDDYNNNNYYDNDREVSYQTFYDELSPYGQWIEYPGHGYVWVPDADQDFQPYSTNGHWVWTDNYEWMWVSDYDWGWAPFHYGRWDHDPYYGWYWVPGYEWSPAWVAWRDGGDYYGWAPIRPGINISVNFNIGSYSPPYNFWCFAPRRYISSPYIHRYYVDRGRNVTIINQTTIIVNNYRYGGNYGFRSGPSRFEAERYCGRINPVRFSQSTNPGRTFYRNNEVSVYRPRVRQDNNRNIAPRQFERFERREGSFRNERFNNGDFRNNNGRENGNMNNRNNNLPERREFDRRNNNDGNSNVYDRRRFDRTDNNGQGNSNNRPDSRRITRPPDRNSQGNTNTPSDNRRFDRRSDENNPGNAPTRQPNNRSFENERPERRALQQMERRQETRSMPQQQPRQFERRENSRQQQPQQMERRQETRQPQARQVERSENNNRQPSEGRGNGNGNSRRRF